MRVAFVHPDAPGAEGTGATHTATLLVRGLVARGHDVTVFARNAADTPAPDTPAPDTPAPDTPAPDTPAPDTAPEGEEPIGDAGRLTVRRLERPDRPTHTATATNRALRAALEAGRFEGMDVVHSYLPSTLPALGDIGAAVPARTVVTLNAYGGVCPKNDLRYMDRERCRDRGLLRCTACSVATSPGNDRFGAGYRTVSRLGNLRQIEAGLRRLDGIDVFQALSPAVADAYAAFDVPADRTVVVPNPVDPAFRVDHDTPFEPPAELLYVGALERHKGVDRLLPALDALLADGIDARLTVVGTGGRRAAMASQARTWGLTDRVTFTGHRPYAELPAVYARHDLFVYPGAWEEPFGRVFLEALAAGTPVVATDVGVVDDIIGDAGVVTDPSVAGLADGVASAIRTRGLAALAARTRARLDRFELDRVLDAHESVYAGALAGDAVGWCP